MLRSTQPTKNGEGIVEETWFLARGKTVADESGLWVTLENLNNWFVA
ncbi:MAG: hypothetical protein ACRCT1_17310 [Microcoleaceae cyanobacterium]